MGSTVVVAVVGRFVVGTGLASGGVNSQSSINLNSISSTATKPFPLFFRPTTN